MIHRELHLLSKQRDSRLLVEDLRAFTEASSAYEAVPELTARYRQMIGADAYVLLAIYQEPLPSIHLASTDGETMCVTNIVPQTRSELSVSEYNSFLSDFAEALGQFSKQSHRGIRIRLSSGELTLESAISGPKTRKYFEQYLAHYPTSYHRCDTLRLDHFIGAASRNPRCQVNIERLYQYLVTVLDWAPGDAKWCVDRITTGLEVLEAQRQR
jgi:hypothetical protein